MMMLHRKIEIGDIGAEILTMEAFLASVQACNVWNLQAKDKRGEGRWEGGGGTFGSDFQINLLKQQIRISI